MLIRQTVYLVWVVEQQLPGLVNMFLGHLVRELKRERTLRGPKSVSKVKVHGESNGSSSRK